MTVAYLGIGSNLGDRLSNLDGAVKGLGDTPGVSVTAVSSVYRTAPVGPVAQPDFLNAVVALHTTKSARELLELAQHLEKKAHRTRHERWGPRTLDVDLLVYGDQTIDEPDLKVPHPGISERRFVMVPLVEVAPDLVMPNGALVADMLAELPDTGDVFVEHNMRIEW